MISVLFKYTFYRITKMIYYGTLGEVYVVFGVDFLNRQLIVFFFYTHKHLPA